MRHQIVHIRESINSYRLHRGRDPAVGLLLVVLVQQPHPLEAVAGLDVLALRTPGSTREAARPVRKKAREQSWEPPGQVGVSAHTYLVRVRRPMLVEEFADAGLLRRVC